MNISHGKDSLVDSNLLISKKDEVFLHVKCEKHIAQELSEYFTFYVPGHQFVPAFRNKIWDGKIRLFSLQNNNLYYGLLSYLEEFCKSRDYTFEYDETRPDIEDEFSVYHATKFIDSLNLHSQNKPISVREHQINAFIHAMQKRRALLLSPTASGKSLIIYLLIRQLLDYQKLKGLVIVPTTSLCSQLESDFKDYSSQNNFNVEDNVSTIMAGLSKNPTKTTIKITMEDDSILEFLEHDIVKTKRGDILAKNLLMEDEII